MSFDLEKLYALLPAIYRTRDRELAAALGLLLDDQEETELQNLLALASKVSAAQAARRQELLEKRRRARGPLKAWLSVIAEQIAVLEEDLDQLYDDLFIETCAEWVVPYIGDLVGTRNLAVFPQAPFSQRSLVANTLRNRRRKGTAAVIEQLAQEVTAPWGANVVEYFQLLATTQYLKHLRPDNLSLAGVRHWENLEYFNTPFDQVARTVEVRRIASRRGKYNIPNVGIFLWRLGSYPLNFVPAFDGGDGRRYRFDALGKDTALYTSPETEDLITHLAGPRNVPIPINRRIMARDKDIYYGRGKSLALNVNGVEIPAAEIVVCNLSDAGSAWAHMPTDKYAIDPVLGRIALPAGLGPSPEVHISYHYGFSTDMGGGQYGRETTFVGGSDADLVRVPDDRTTIQEALDQLADTGGVVEITNNAYYVETPHVQVAGDVSEGHLIELRAAEERRPVLVPGADMLVCGGENSEVTLNGFLISGGRLRVPVLDNQHNPNRLRVLRLRHCTLLPGESPAIRDVGAQPAAPRLVIEAPNTMVEIEASIIGGIRAAQGAQVRIVGSIVDATDETAVAYGGLAGVEAGAPLQIENSTVIGQVHTLRLDLASNTIFVAQVVAEQLQQGCVRFCYLPPKSLVPRGYNCQPYLALAQRARELGLAAVSDLPDVERQVILSALTPGFTSTRYGDPGYCQLSPSCAVEIQEGAEDQAEMGAFHDLYQPQRKANLRARLDEYLRFGLEAGIFYAS
ncbi:MAG: hypothetical protein P8168_01730 [Deltaproteobacteria bacterium]